MGGHCVGVGASGLEGGPRGRGSLSEVGTCPKGVRTPHQFYHFQ